MACQAKRSPNIAMESKLPFGIKTDIQTMLVCLQNKALVPLAVAAKLVLRNVFIEQTPPRN
jgi:hypothetical protein